MASLHIADRGSPAPVGRHRPLIVRLIGAFLAIPGLARR
jgi:hypothetical protein